MTGQPLAGNPQRPACHVYTSANVSYASGAQTPVQFDREKIDTDNMHSTSTANLTGTVAKTSGQATLTGTSTLFTTELAVGDAIFVPDAGVSGWIAGEFAVVIAIASDTSLTINKNWGSTISGQTARHAAEAVVFRTYGLYWVHVGVAWALSGGAGTRRTFELGRNGSWPNYVEDIVNPEYAPAPAGSTVISAGSLVQASAYEFVVLSPFQNSGLAVNVLAAHYYTFIQAAWLSV